MVLILVYLYTVFVNLDNSAWLLLLHCFCNHRNKRWKLLDRGSGYSLFTFKINFVIFLNAYSCSPGQRFKQIPSSYSRWFCFHFFHLVCFFSGTPLSRCHYYTCNETMKSTAIDGLWIRWLSRLPRVSPPLNCHRSVFG
jgi:hypothetical protein